jgi:hypothetical protein
MRPPIGKTNRVVNSIPFVEQLARRVGRDDAEFQLILEIWSRTASSV